VTASVRSCQAASNSALVGRTAWEVQVGSGPWSAAAVASAVAELLRAAGVEDAAAEARDLVALVCGRPRFWSLIEPEAEVPLDALERCWKATQKRVLGAPLAYATRVAHFRFLTLVVDERVLIPRPETEMLVELVLSETGGAGGVVADVGTGSGAIALALASEGRYGRVIATDLSSDALAVAAVNLRRLGDRLRAPVELRHGAGLAPVAEDCLDALVSNPPYIALEEAGELPASVRDWEPPLALFSSDGGLAVTVDLVRQAHRVLRPGGLLALECDSRRACAVARLMEAVGSYRDIRVELDLAGRARYVVARRSAEPGL
jgi:release factor glutamine methyltransferase